jgi:hypothetical protein
VGDHLAAHPHLASSRGHINLFVIQPYFTFSISITMLPLFMT